MNSRKTQQQMVCQYWYTKEPQTQVPGYRFVIWFFFLILAFARPMDAGAQDVPDSVVRETVIVGVQINRREVPRQEWSDLVISRTDTITLDYRCRVNLDKFDAKLFRLLLKSDDGRAWQDAVRSPSILWTGLEQKKYTFVVLAFAPGTWQASPDSLHFTVDDVEAARRQQLAKPKPTAVPQDTIVPKNQSGGSLRESLYIIVGIIAALGFGVIVLQVRRQRRRVKTESQEKNGTPHMNTSTDITDDSNAEEKDGDSMIQDTLSYEQLQKENSALRAEIAALRGQIEALQVRTNELQKTNRELASQKERLLEHKKQLEELQVQKDELFSMVVHDMKNPAGLIRGLVELLRSYDLTAQEQQEIMEDLMATSTRILSLAQEVSRIVTLESGALKLDFNSYPVARIIEDVCRRNLVSASKKHIGFQVDIAPQLPESEVDVQKIEEVLDNLVSNAIKFSNNESQIKVKAYKTGENIVVEVIDNGPGLTEADIKRAFGRGARLSAKPTAGESSSGLGLWIVKKIVEAHHGRVWVKSSIMKGSTFAFELPLSQPVIDSKSV